MAKDPKNNALYRRNMSRLNSADVGTVVVHPTKIAMHHKEREKMYKDAEKVKMNKISEKEKSNLGEM